MAAGGACIRQSRLPIGRLMGCAVCRENVVEGGVFRDSKFTWTAFPLINQWPICVSLFK